MFDAHKHWYWRYRYGKRQLWRGLSYMPDYLSQIFIGGLRDEGFEFKRASWFAVIVWVGGWRYLRSFVLWWLKVPLMERITIVGIAATLLTWLIGQWINRCPCPV